MKIKKKIYHTVDIKKVDINKLKEFTAGKRIVFSVDAAKRNFFGAFQNTDKETILNIKWQSPGEVGLLLTLLKKLEASQLEMAMEPTSTYGDALREQAEQEGVDVYLVSAKKCHDAREVFDGVPSSHDAKSAAIIGRLHLDGISKPWPKKSEEQRKLASEMIIAKIMRKQLDDNVNRLEAQLARYWPELPEILSLDSAALLGLLETYGGPKKVIENKEAAYETIKFKGRSLTLSKLERVICSADDTIGVAMIEAEEEAIKKLAMEIDRNRVGLRESQKEIKKIMNKNKTRTDEMSKVIGQVTTAVLWVALGDPLSYDSAGGYVKAAGLNLKERSSGEYNGCLKITKRGSGEVRQYIYLAVLRLIQSDGLIKKWYSKKVARDGGKKMKAIVALMRKLMRGLWKASCDGVPFDSQLLFDRTRLL